MPIDASTLATLQSLRMATRRGGDWKAAFDRLLALIREEFVFDNTALYLLDPGTRSLDVAHARAAGRGRTAEADVSWGESIAGKVVAGREPILEEPAPGPYADRLRAPYLIGLPVLVAGSTAGALVFVRFGGPPYSELHRMLANWIADTVSSMLEARALERARAEMDATRRQIRLQDDFVSTISHELRTPLGFIKGYTSSLLREDTTWDLKTQREFLTIIEEETDRLAQLIENMLESARFQSRTAKFRFQPVQLDALVRDVTLRVRARKPDLKVLLEFDRVPPILGDSLRLSQVFENLFSNAIKYAAGSPVTIGLVPDGGTLQVRFSDQGPGIPEEHLPFLFDRFYRAHEPDSPTGTGLGLYICEQIVLAHHGKIRAESVLDQGTTFIIELPLRASS
jgi:signal transduction histidine kinase